MSEKGRKKVGGEGGEGLLSERERAATPVQTHEAWAIRSLNSQPISAQRELSGDAYYTCLSSSSEHFYQNPARFVIHKKVTAVRGGTASTVDALSEFHLPDL